jgi:predicted P-loop ATPase
MPPPSKGAFLFIMNISFFASLPQKGKPHTSTDVMHIDDFINGIKYGKWKDVVEPIRNEQDKAIRASMKRNLPSVTVGGVFKERKQDELIQHSGFICLDIDNYSDRNALIQDPYTYALFNSTSGNGIAVICKIKPEKHKESYNWLSNYYFSTYGISVDPAPKNVASLRFVSYDPTLFHNQKSITSRTKTDNVKRPQSLPLVFSGSMVDELVSKAVSMGVNIAPTYADYLNLGFALANGFGEDGRQYFHALCCISEKYDQRQADKQYNYCLQGKDKAGVTVGTFYWMLKQAGVELPKKNDRAIQLAAMGKKSGRTKEGVKEHLKQIESLADDEAEIIATQVFERDDISLKSVAADPERLIESLIEWVKLNHPIRKNSLTRKLEENGNEVTKERKNTIFLRARMVFNSKEVTHDLVDSIIHSDLVAEFNPLTEYIDKNRHRKSSGNIDSIIATIATDTPNAELFIRKWLVSIIAAYDGCPVRSVLALVGGQNTGKTEWFRRLLPAAIRQYYAESKLDAGKDDEILMTQKLIVMDDEMGGKSKQDEKRFKELTSKQIFSLRAPYGQHNEDFKRLAILCGTSNDPAVINDPTGNTRILPINVLSINHEAYNSIDKDELFIELVRAYESGYEWQLTKDELADLSEVSDEFEVTPLERELILQNFKRPERESDSEYLTSTQIKDIIETNTRQKIMSLRKFGLELTRVFGKAKCRKMNGSVLKCYPVYRLLNGQVTSQPIDNQQVPF